MITLIDCDGVMAKWTDMFIRVCREQFDINPTINDGKTWDFFNYPEVVAKKNDIWKYILSTKGLIRDLEKYDYADELIAKLRERGEVVCVTSIVSGGYYADERIMWLIEEMGFPRTHIILAYRKFMVEGDIFIDDKPSNVVEWADRWYSECGTPVLWQPPEKPMTVDDERIIQTGNVDDLIKYIDAQEIIYEYGVPKKG